MPISAMALCGAGWRREEVRLPRAHLGGWRVGKRVEVDTGGEERFFRVPTRVADEAGAVFGEQGGSTPRQPGWLSIQPRICAMPWASCCACSGAG